MLWPKIFKLLKRFINNPTDIQIKLSGENHKPVFPVNQSKPDMGVGGRPDTVFSDLQTF